MVRTSLTKRLFGYASLLCTIFLATVAHAQTTPQPFVLLLHGSSQQGGDALYESQLDKRAAELNATVLAPSGQDGVWRPRDVAPLQALIKTAIANGTADAARIVVAGFSNGGDMAWRLACDGNVPIAAIVIVGMPIARSITQACPNTSPVRLLIMGGTADPLVPYRGGPLPVFDGFGVLSTDDTAAFWAKRNQCSDGPFTEETHSPVKSDPVTANRIVWAGCTAPVELLSLVGGGHVWPNQPGFHPLSFQRLRGAIARSVDTVTELGKVIAALPATTPEASSR